MEVDFLLVGQGIAGTLLSYRLINAGKKVHVIDQAEKNNCSRAAAGIYNPVTGRKMVKTWNADLLFPEIEPFYRQLEQELKSKFLYKRPIYRPFGSIEELNEWMGHSGEESFKVYIEAIKTIPAFKEVNDPHGGLLLGQSGYLDINTMLDRYTFWLKERGILTNEEFDEVELKFSEKGFVYKNINAQSLIYANGMGAVKSKFFHWLPLRPNKGEILVIKQGFTPQEIINRGIFRITLPDRTIKVGSTYSVDNLGPGPTEKAKEEMLEKLEKLVNLPVEEILEHKAGIRPTTIDRRPILGKHPENRNVYIFNGLGAKGVSLAPYFSKIMLNLLIFGNEPHKEVNISRFFKYI
ncbi:MAG: FAD-binding oxidoreductase [Anditalea sp.]